LPTVLTIDFAYAVLLRSIVIITLPTIHVGNIASLPPPNSSRVLSLTRPDHF